MKIKEFKGCRDGQDGIVVGVLGPAHFGRHHNWEHTVYQQVIIITMIRFRIRIKMTTKKFRCDSGGWCGERRKNSETGAVQRCAERTR